MPELELQTTRALLHQNTRLL